MGMEGMRSGSQGWESGLHEVHPWFVAHSSLPQHKADLHSDPNVAEEEEKEEEEEEGGTAEKHIAHNLLDCSTGESTAVDKWEANWLTLHIIPTLQYMKGLFLATMGVL